MQRPPSFEPVCSNGFHSANNYLETQDGIRTKESSIVDAILWLNKLLLMFFFIVGCTVCFLIVYYYNNIPLYSIFIFEWICHLLSVFLFVRIANLMMEGLSVDFYDIMRGRISVQSRDLLPMVSYVVKNISYFGYYGIVLLILELLIFSHFYLDLSIQFAIALVTIAVVLEIFSCIIFRTSSYHGLVTWVLFLVFVFLLDYSLVVQSISWWTIFTPVIFIELSFLLLSLKGIVYFASGSYELKKYQVQVLLLYFVSFLFLLLATFWGVELLSSSSGFYLEYIPIFFALVVFGVFGVAAGWTQIYYANNALVISRKGAVRPRSLTRLSRHTWDFDEKHYHENHYLLGEIEVYLTSQWTADMIRWEKNCFSFPASEDEEAESQPLLE